VKLYSGWSLIVPCLIYLLLSDTIILQYQLSSSFQHQVVILQYYASPSDLVSFIDLGLSWSFGILL